jgi:hypothetical protein
MTPEQRLKVIDDTVAAFESVSDLVLDDALDSSNLVTQTLAALKQERVPVLQIVEPVPVRFDFDDEIAKIADNLSSKDAPTVTEAKKFISTEMDRIRAILKAKTRGASQ